VNTPEDYMEAADEAGACAETLMGKGTLSDREFLETMARCDRLADHPDALEAAGTCGTCATLICHAEAARHLLAEGEVLDGIKKWSELSRQMWQDTKYFKLYQEEQEAGRDPHEAFNQRGWEL
jgi:hypothetical protein